MIMPAKIGFGYSTFGTNKYDQTAETSDFNTAAAATSSSPNVRFIFNGHIYDEYVLSLSPIRISTNLEANGCQITLSNTDGSWNYIRTYGYVGHMAIVRIGIYFTGIVGIKYLMTGYVDEARFEDDLLVLSIKDKFIDAFDKTIGSGYDEIDYGVIWYFASSLAWHLCDIYGNFDGSYSPANPDLNYPAWQTWSEYCLADQYIVWARFAGQDLRSALLQIAQMTNSVFYVDGEGRLTPSMFRPPYTSSSYTFNVNNCLAIDVSVQVSKIKNSIKVAYGEDMYRYAETITTLEKSSAYSIALYGKHPIVFESRMIWFKGQWAANKFAIAYLNHWENPAETINLKTTLYGFLVDLTTPIYVVEPLKDLAQYYWPEAIEYDPVEFTATLTGRKADI